MLAYSCPKLRPSLKSCHGVQLPSLLTGLQDARKGVRFKAFPPVLFLQLKRFEYDYDRQSTVKVKAQSSRTSWHAKANQEAQGVLTLQLWSLWLQPGALHVQPS